MFFLFEERRAFVRTATHTVIPDTDPEFERFAGRIDGRTESWVRIWIVRSSTRRVRPSAYLGTVRIVAGRVRRPTWRRVLRQVDAAAPSDVRVQLSARLLRHLTRFAEERAPRRAAV